MSLFPTPGSEDVVVRQRRVAARRSLLLPAAVAAVLLACAGLSHAFTTTAWFPMAAVAVLLAFGLGWAGRRLGVPALLAPFLSYLGLAVVFGWVYAGSTTAYGVPTGETVRALGDRLSRGLDDVRVLVAPVDVNDDLTMLAAGGVFVVAVLVDLIVFRARRPAVAGLPLLALYVIPAAVRDDPPGVLLFATAAAGYVTLLVAEGRDRARAWGRRLAGRDVVEDLVDTSPVARVGRRLGVAAVSFAVAVPLLVPDLGDGLLGPGAGGGPGLGDGPSSREVINPIVNLKPQLRDANGTPLLVVRTTRPEYLRLTSLDLFDGQKWSQSTLSAPAQRRVEGKTLPRPPGLGFAATENVLYDVQVRGLDVPWLPAPYAAVRANVEGDWRWDDDSRTIFSAKRTTRNLEYTVTSTLVDPTPDQLDGTFPQVDDDLEHYLEIPDEVSSLAEGVLADLRADNPSPYALALAMQTFFRETGGFVYDLDVAPGQSRSQLDDFLTRRRGYCEQFAATFAYLMRLAGVPARVAIGFTPGTRVDTNRYVITTREAHAWPEVYFENVGWVRFEPTPRSDSVVTTPPDYARPSTGPGSDPSAAPTAAPEPSASAGGPSASATPSTPGQDREDLSDGRNDPAAAGGGGDAGGVSPWVVIALLLLAAAGAVPGTARLLLRRRRAGTTGDPVAVVNAAWTELADVAEDHGRPLRASDSPRQAAARLAGAVGLTGPARTALTELATAEERARYAPRPPDAKDLLARVSQVRSELAADLRRTERLRVALLPPSTLRRGRVAGRRLWAGLLDRGDELTGRVRQRLPFGLGARGRHAA